MSIFLHPGIGEKFTYKKRKWRIIDLRDKEYTCKTTDNEKKPEEIRMFSMTDMIKICKK